MTQKKGDLSNVIHLHDNFNRKKIKSAVLKQEQLFMKAVSTRDSTVIQWSLSLQDNPKNQANVVLNEGGFLSNKGIFLLNKGWFLLRNKGWFSLNKGWFLFQKKGVKTRVVSHQGGLVKQGVVLGFKKRGQNKGGLSSGWSC